MAYMMVKYFFISVSVILLALASSDCDAAITFAIDLDTNTTGIQNTRTVTVGQNFNVDLFIILSDGTSASSWQLSTQYSPSLLNLVSRNEFNPGGMTESDTSNPTSGGLIRRLGFDAQVGPTSPFSQSFARFNFDAILAGTSTITPGFFETGLDGAFDNNFDVLTPVFAGGTLTISAVPEPTSLVLILAALVGGLPIRKRLSNVFTAGLRDRTRCTK
jgi:hypothetical protein